MTGEAPSSIQRMTRQSLAVLVVDGTLGCAAESRNSGRSRCRRLVVEYVVTGYLPGLPVGLLLSTDGT